MNTLEIRKALSGIITMLIISSVLGAEHPSPEILNIVITVEINFLNRGISDWRKNERFFENGVE